MMNEVRTISSDFTLGFKTVIPTLTIVALVIGIPTLIREDFFRWRDWSTYIGIAFGLALFGNMFWTSIQLKKVAIKEDVLLVSNFLKEIEIPLRDIRRVESSVININCVNVFFRGPTEFGTQITFLSHLRSFPFARSVVEELKILIDKEKFKEE